MPQTLPKDINFPSLSEELDSDHREIIFFIRQLAYNHEDSNLTKISSTLLNYVTSHFKREEAFMRDVGYVSGLLDIHTASHNELADMFNQELKDIETRSSTEIDTVINILVFCLASHINSYDNTLSNWLNRKSRETNGQ